MGELSFTVMPNGDRITVARKEDFIELKTVLKSDIEEVMKQNEDLKRRINLLEERVFWYHE